MDLRHSFQHAAGHAIAKERQKGNHERANGLTLVVMSLFLMPIPVIGVPMFIYGIIKCCSAPDHSKS